MDRLYFDNAATSWPKPESVYVAVDRYQREVGVAAGRGSYRDSEEVSRLINQLRSKIANLIGAQGPDRIAFTQNCTDSLNLALHGLLNDGDHVVSTVAEHNSILRPLHELRQRGVTSTLVGLNETGGIDAGELAAAIRPETRLIAVTHASNVTGFILPLNEIRQIARQHDCLVLLDAAQTLGHVPINVVEAGVDILAAPGHKGLLGPLGTGLIYLAPGLEDLVRSVRQGGTGTQSELAEQPSQMPAKFEAGNLNVPGLVGLDAGVQHVLDQQQELLDKRHFEACTEMLIAALQSLTGVTIYSVPNRTGIVSFNVEGYDPREFATLLDSAAAIQVRAGLHCAPLMHRQLGTLEMGGAVRVSFGHWSTEAEIAKLIDAVSMLAAAALG